MHVPGISLAHIIVYTMDKPIDKRLNVMLMTDVTGRGGAEKFM